MMASHPPEQPRRFKQWNPLSASPMVGHIPSENHIGGDSLGDLLEGAPTKEEQHYEQQTTMDVDMLSDSETETEGGEELEMDDDTSMNGIAHGEEQDDANGPQPTPTSLEAIPANRGTSDDAVSTQIDPPSSTLEPATISPADELLMQVAVEREAEFADSTVRNRDVWNAIATECKDPRIADGLTAKARVCWLVQVVQDYAHTAHDHLTDELKRLLEQYRDMRERCTSRPSGNKKRKRLVVFDRSKRQKRRKLMKIIRRDPTLSLNQSDAAEEDASADKVAAVNSLPANPTRQQAPLDAALEEKVMSEVVLPHAPRFATSEAKVDVWEAIAKASQGRYKTGERARFRTAWLCKVLKSPLHEEHAKLTPALRNSLIEFLKLEPSPHRRLASSSASIGENRAEPRLPATKRVETAVDVVPSHQAKSKSKFMVDPAEDELFLRLIVEKRPFAVEQKRRKTCIWAEISRDCALVHSGLSGAQRLRMLVNVMKDPQHREHKKLTPRLRELLEEYVEASESSSASSRVVVEPTALVDQITPTGEASGAGNETPDNPHEHQPPTASDNEALVREILRVRPFNTTQGRLPDKWEEVCRSVGNAVVFPTAKACVVQMKRLLYAARHPDRLSSIALRSPLVAHIDKLMKTHGTKSLVTTMNRVAQVQIDKPLRASGPLATPNATDIHQDQRADSMPSKNEQDERQDSSEGDGTVRQEAEETEQLATLEHKRKHDDEQLLTPATPTEQLDERQTKRAQVLHSDTGKTEPTESDKIKSLRTKLAICRAEMALQREAFENERREFRQEREASTREKVMLMELLKAAMSSQAPSMSTTGK